MIEPDWDNVTEYLARWDSEQRDAIWRCEQADGRRIYAHAWCTRWQAAEAQDGTVLACPCGHVGPIVDGHLSDRAYRHTEADHEAVVRIRALQDRFKRK